MKKFLLSLAFLAAGIGAQAQVANNALRLLADGTVNLGSIAELSGQQAYTLQMWLCPEELTPGALILQRGDMSLTLGRTAGTLTYASGSTQLELSAGLATGVWKHVTLTVDGTAVTLHSGTRRLDLQTASGLQLASTNEPLVVGGGFTGRVDELRLWQGALEADYERFYRTTLNEYCPAWDRLAAYYTFDQVRCPAVYDYSGRGHHGTFSLSGATREEVTDNADFRYRINLAYADWSRFFDRAVDAEKYRLSNYVSMIGISTAADGTATLQYPFHEAVPQGGAKWLADYEGRSGVMAFDGQEGSRLAVESNVLDATDGYSFMAWLYIDEWTEGAYIFRKERSATEGFSIRLGSADTRQVIVRCNGREYIRDKKLQAGRWTHLCVSTNVTTNQGEVFLFAIDGVGSFPSRGNFPTELYDYKLPDLQGVTTYLGEGLKGKMDDAIAWNAARPTSEIEREMVKPRMPGPGEKCDAAPQRNASAYWDFSRPEQPGYDSYSYRHYFNIIRACYGDCEGYHLLICASGHSGWESTFANTTTRTKLAKALAAIANQDEFDGLDLDFEWTYSASGWANYAALCKTIRENLKPGKKLSCSPHQVAYAFPVSEMKYVDFFNFQIYGPGQVYLFTQDGYTSALQQFTQHGYPKDKIVMSYATTTSGGCDASGNVIRNGGAISHPPVGYRNLFGPDTKASDNRGKYGDCYYYFTGYDQSVWRAQQCHQQQLGGIMYWDMGNDIATSEPLSLVRGASMALNSNVVPLHTHVEGELPDAIDLPTTRGQQANSSQQTYDLTGRVVFPKGGLGKTTSPLGKTRRLLISDGRKVLSH